MAAQPSTTQTRPTSSFPSRPTPPGQATTHSSLRWHKGPHVGMSALDLLGVSPAFEQVDWQDAMETLTGASC